jgi:hypothetical protein
MRLPTIHTSTRSRNVDTCRLFDLPHSIPHPLRVLLGNAEARLVEEGKHIQFGISIWGLSGERRATRARKQHRLGKPQVCKEMSYLHVWCRLRAELVTGPRLPAALSGMGAAKRDRTMAPWKRQRRADGVVRVMRGGVSSCDTEIQLV